VVSERRVRTNILFNEKSTATTGGITWIGQLN